MRVPGINPADVRKAHWNGLERHGSQGIALRPPTLSINQVSLARHCYGFDRLVERVMRAAEP